MNLLVDTSVWVDHFKHPNSTLVSLLINDLVLTHPMVLLELACGTPPAPRTRTLDDIRLLRQAHQPTLEEVGEFVEREKLYGLGCGLVDVCLLTSSLISPDAMLWTLDQRLEKMAKRFNVSYQPNI